MTNKPVSPGPALIIFVKLPKEGRVKTRLAATVGAPAALNIYKSLLLYTKQVSEAFAGQRYVYYHNHPPDDDIWMDKSIIRRTQSGSNLGGRMHTAFDEVLADHPSALIIGSDCGELTSGHLARAVDALNWSDVVIGPATDGGYYLLGMKRLHPALFEDIAWSTETVLDTTITRMLAAGLSFRLLGQLSDVDTEEDWNRLGWSQHANEEE